MKRQPTSPHTHTIVKINTQQKKQIEFFKNKVVLLIFSENILTRTISTRTQTKCCE